MKRIGVWMDKQKALVVSLEDNNISLKEILSEVETYRIHGGSGTRFKGGPQDVVQDSRYLEREKHQLKKYFYKVVEEVKHAEEILIFGPAEIPLKFNKELIMFEKEISEKVKDVKKADSMTVNQVKAYVREFFS